MKVEIKIIGAEHMQPEDVADLMSAVSDAVDSQLGDPEEEGKSWVEMPYKERAEAYNKIIEYFGEKHQCWKAIEELAELTQAISRYLEADCCLDAEAMDNIIENLIEEIADATIVAEQLRLIFHCNDDVKLAMADKIERTLERMEKG